MAIVPDSKIEEIRRRADIVEVVQTHTRLKKAGRNWVGLCPFHQEKTPSFNVNPDLQIFKCFGCQRGGDVFRFVMDANGLSFPEALKMLAERYGVEVHFQEGAARSTRGSREELFAINDAASAFYHKLLFAEDRGRPARDYLEKRGVTLETARRFRLGWAPDAWDETLGELKRRRVNLDRAEHLGLLVKNAEGRYYDRFRGRLMFPIRNTAGKTIGFSGRVLVGDEKAKYINSVESDVFHKSDNFYGLDLAMDAIRKGGRAVLCEGNLDVIMLHQYGFDDALACLGTALTENHVRRLARMADTVTMIFDGDDAGRRAMRRALELFLPQDVQPRCVVMPAGDDPDSFVRREGAEPMAALLGGAPTLVEFAVNDAFGREAADNEGRAKAVNDLVPVLRRIGDPVLRDLWIKTVAERARVGEPALRKRITERQRARPEANEPVRRASAGDERDAEKELVRLLLNHPRLAHHFVEERLGEFVTNPALRRLAERIADRALDSQDKTDYAPAQLLGELSDPSLQDEVAGWAIDDGGIGERDARRAYDDLSRTIRTVSLNAQLDDVEERLRAATAQGDQRGALALMQEKLNLKRTLEDAGSRATRN